MIQDRWPSRPLRECGQLFSGGTPSKANESFWRGELPWFSSKEIRSFDLHDTELHVSEDATARGTTLVPSGTVLFVVRGMSLANEFRVGVTMTSATFNQDVKALVPASGIDGRYLARCLRWMEPRILATTEESAHGTKRLPSAAFEGLPIPLPPLKEQQRIVGMLDEAFEGIAKAKANAERNLENARAVFESAREDALAPKDGWHTGPLGDLCSVKHGFAFKGEFFTNAGEFVLLTPGSFFERGGYRERGEKTKYYVGEIPPEFLLNEGDMLTAMTEQAAGLLGSPLIVPESDKFLHNQRLGLFVPTPGKPWATKFFFHTMNLARIRKEIHDGGTGAKVRHTSPGRIRAVRVSYPGTKKEQQVVADRLDEIVTESERIELIYERKVAALDELKKSLLHNAFAGAL